MTRPAGTQAKYLWISGATHVYGTLYLPLSMIFIVIIYGGFSLYAVVTSLYAVTYSLYSVLSPLHPPAAYSIPRGSLYNEKPP